MYVFPSQIHNFNHLLVRSHLGGDLDLDEEGERRREDFFSCSCLATERSRKGYDRFGWGFWNNYCFCCGWGSSHRIMYSLAGWLALQQIANPVENILNHLSFWTISGSLEKLKRTPEDPEASRNCYIAVQYSKLLCARSCYQSYPIVIYLLISSHNFFCITPFSKNPMSSQKTSPNHQKSSNHAPAHQHHFWPKHKIWQESTFRPHIQFAGG